MSGGNDGPENIEGFRICLIAFAVHLEGDCVFHAFSIKLPEDSVKDYFPESLRSRFFWFSHSSRQVSQRRRFSP